MASFVAQAIVSATTAAPSPEVNLALSGVFGSISLVAWICVLVPQLITNFRAQSADGLSMAFLIVWLLGDVTNLLGALFTHLAPTAIALPSYFCVADMVLISQVVYYNSRNKARAARAARAEAGDSSEESPLLRRQDSSPSATNGAQNGTATGSHDVNKDISPPGEMEARGASPWLFNTGALVAVYVVGAASWFISYKAGAWDAVEPSPDGPDGPDEVNNPLEMAGLTLGYISAVCYLCARIPQIIKNYKSKSCEGLALLFFLLSLTGNLTYGISLLVYSQDKKYLLNAFPFLLGSIGTIVEDCIIFVQFRLYSNNPRRASVGA